MLFYKLGFLLYNTVRANFFTGVNMKNKKKICLFVFLMVLGSCAINTNCCVYASDNSNASSETAEPVQEEIKGNKDAFEKASDCINNKDYQSAIVYLTAYITAKPKKYEAYKLRGDAFYALRQYILAQNDYQTAVDIKTDDDKFMTGTKVVGAVVLGADKQEQLQNAELGNLYGRLMYAQKALNNPAYETSYDKAVQYNSHIYLPAPKQSDIALINCPQKYGKIVNPQGVDEYIYGAIDDIENSNFNEAIYKIQYVTSNYPKYYLGYYLTGVALSALEKEKEAEISFNNALKYNPYDFESMASLGQIYYSNAEKTFSVEDAKKSIEYFNKALKYNPNCYIYYFYLGLDNLQMGNVDLAISNFDSAIKYKSNDYNSMYYKLIAQYIKGDYKSVIDGCTSLLYRHVSNYNSVLYLKALAESNIALYDDALADLGKIQNDVDDIYNADVKVISDRDKTLETYVYYLKSQILNKQGFGAKSDLAKASQNPIISTLSNVENSISELNKNLNSDTISLEDYKKYDNFYKNSLPSMLPSSIVVTSDDIDNQYDYLRTTFDNLGLTFIYMNPNYKITTIDNYVYKKYSSKLSPEDKITLKSQQENIPEIRGDIQDSKPLLTQTTKASDIIADESKPSIAQILASQSLSQYVAPQKPEISDIVKPAETVSLITEDKPIVIKSVPVTPAQVEPSASVSQTDNNSVATSGVKLTAKEIKPASGNDNFEIKNETKQIPSKIENEPKLVVSDNLDTEKHSETVSVQPIQPQEKSDSVKIVAEEVKQTPDFTVSYAPLKETKSQETKLASADLKIENSDIKSANSNSEQKTTEEITSSAKPQKVTEKYAQVDEKEFGKINKQLPIIENESDVVELEPSNFIFQAEQKVKSEPFDIKYQKQPQKNSSLKLSDFSSPAVEAVQNVEKGEVSKQVEQPSVILPEEPVAKVQDKTVSVPIVVVPEISVPKNIENKTATVEKIASADTVASESSQAKNDDMSSHNLNLRPQAEISDDIVQKPLTQENIISQAPMEKDVKKVKSQKNKIEKVKPEKVVKEKVEKPVKEEKVKTEKIKKEKIKKEKPIKPEKVKALKPEKIKAEKPAKVRTEKPVKVKQDKKKSKNQKAISSIVQSTIGSDSVEENNNLTNISNSKEKVKTEKVKQVKPVKIKKEKPQKVKVEKPAKIKPEKVKKEQNSENNGFWTKFTNLFKNNDKTPKVKEPKQAKIKATKPAKVKTEKIKKEKVSKTPKVKKDKSSLVDKVLTKESGDVDQTFEVNSKEKKVIKKLK